MAESKFETIKGTLQEYGNVLSKGDFVYRSVTVADPTGEVLTGEHWSKDKKTLEAYEDLKGQEVEYSFTVGTDKSTAKLRVYPVKTEKDKADYKAKSGGGSNWNNPERFEWEKARGAVNDQKLESQSIRNAIAPFYLEMYKNKSRIEGEKLIDVKAFITLLEEKVTEIQLSLKKD